LRQETQYALLSKPKGLHVFRAARPAPGNPRPADPQGRGAWTSAWLGHFRAPSSNLQRHTPDPTGIALSCASSPRATRVDQIALGHIGYNRRAKYYELTGRGRAQLQTQTTAWRRLAAAIGQVLETA